MPTTRTQTRSRKTSSSNGRSRTRSRGRRPATRKAEVQVNDMQVEELVLQALETELGGVQVYETALRCAMNDELRAEWQKYHKQTQHHVEVVERLCQDLGIDTEKETRGRAIVRGIGESLVQAMQEALQKGPGDAAQLVAAECVALAETKDHLNWSLIGELCEGLPSGDERVQAFEEAFDEVEDEEDEHLYHTLGWCRELWIDGLGLPAALPPPEEERDVKSMAQAAKAKGARKQYAKKSR